MKYPKLKCEDKKNTVVCSLDIKKMKKLYKDGYNYSQIGKVMKLRYQLVSYHISPIQNSKEYLEKKRKRLQKYDRQLWNNPEYRQKKIKANSKRHKQRYINDPKFKKWCDQLSYKINLIWTEKRRLKHPNWSAHCQVGAHVTTSRKYLCKNTLKTCKCPCHKV